MNLANLLNEVLTLKKYNRIKDISPDLKIKRGENKRKNYIFYFKDIKVDLSVINTSTNKNKFFKFSFLTSKNGWIVPFGYSLKKGTTLELFSKLSNIIYNILIKDRPHLIFFNPASDELNRFYEKLIEYLEPQLKEIGYVYVKAQKSPFRPEISKYASQELKDEGLMYIMKFLLVRDDIYKKYKRFEQSNPSETIPIKINETLQPPTPQQAKEGKIRNRFVYKGQKVKIIFAEDNVYSKDNQISKKYTEFVFSVDNDISVQGTHKFGTFVLYKKIINEAFKYVAKKRPEIFFYTAFLEEETKVSLYSRLSKIMEKIMNSYGYVLMDEKQFGRVTKDSGINIDDFGSFVSGESAGFFWVRKDGLDVGRKKLK